MVGNDATSARADAGRLFIRDDTSRERDVVSADSACSFAQRLAECLRLYRRHDDRHRKAAGLAIGAYRASQAQLRMRQSVPPSSSVPTKSAEQEYHHYDDQQRIRVHSPNLLNFRGRVGWDLHVDRRQTRCSRCFGVL